MAQRGLCDEIGEGSHDPDMDPSLFQDPRNPTATNPYFLLDIGNRWVYQEEDERIEIVILDETKRVEDIDCIVYNDRVFKDGLLVEDTDDWFAIRTDGTIEYCGEGVQDFEMFEGDDPMDVQLVSIDGSFKAGVDGAKSGTAFLGDPVPDTTYRQEWDAGNAEGVERVLANDYAYGQNEELDEIVPRNWPN
jgi:hypothetical protein